MFTVVRMRVYACGPGRHVRTAAAWGGESTVDPRRTGAARGKHWSVGGEGEHDNDDDGPVAEWRWCGARSIAAFDLLPWPGIVLHILLLYYVHYTHRAPPPGRGRLKNSRDGLRRRTAG